MLLGCSEDASEPQTRGSAGRVACREKGSTSAREFRRMLANHLESVSSVAGDRWIRTSSWCLQASGQGQEELQLKRILGKMRLATEPRRPQRRTKPCGRK